MDASVCDVRVLFGRYFGFWILDFGLIHARKNAPALRPRSAAAIQNPKSKIQNPRYVSLVLCLFLISCNRSAIQGTVLDVEGRPLPGVSVHAADGDGEATTNALGQYSLTTHQGAARLEFIKNGYTSGHLELEVPQGATSSPPAVSLWCLPQSAGVYLFQNSRYRRAAPLEPERFALENNVIFGLGTLPELEATGSSEPFIICHKMPPYDVRMSRLHAIEAMSAQAGKGKQTAWVQEASIPVELLPIDEPERLLMRVKAAEALAPGIYALHWGALDGHTTTDTRVFVFKVVDLSQPEEASPAPPTESAIYTQAMGAEAGDTAPVGTP
jgi:hypothetical protein